MHALSPSHELSRQDYEVRNSVGRLVRTFNDQSLAWKWARKMAPTLGVLTVEEVTVEIKRRKVTTVRPKLSVVK